VVRRTLFEFHPWLLPRSQRKPSEALSPTQPAWTVVRSGEAKALLLARQVSSRRNNRSFLIVRRSRYSAFQCRCSLRETNNNVHDREPAQAFAAQVQWRGRDARRCRRSKPPRQRPDFEKSRVWAMDASVVVSDDSFSFMVFLFHFIQSYQVLRQAAWKRSRVAGWSAYQRWCTLSVPARKSRDKCERLSVVSMEANNELVAEELQAISSSAQML